MCRCSSREEKSRKKTPCTTSLSISYLHQPVIWQEEFHQIFLIRCWKHDWIFLITWWDNKDKEITKLLIMLTVINCHANMVCIYLFLATNATRTQCKKGATSYLTCFEGNYTCTVLLKRVCILLQMFREKVAYVVHSTAAFRWLRCKGDQLIQSADTNQRNFLKISCFFFLSVSASSAPVPAAWFFVCDVTKKRTNAWKTTFAVLQ